jgi:hypothetical protein
MNPSAPWLTWVWTGLTMQGEVFQARAAYEDFFNSWHDADPDIPILKQARAEYAKLLQ